MIWYVAEALFTSPCGSSCSNAGSLPAWETAVVLKMYSTSPLSNNYRRSFSLLTMKIASCTIVFLLVIGSHAAHAQQNNSQQQIEDPAIKLLVELRVRVHLIIKKMPRLLPFQSLIRGY